MPLADGVDDARNHLPGLSPTAKIGLASQLFHGLQRRPRAVSDKGGGMFAVGTGAEGHVMERRRSPLAVVVLQEGPVLAVIVLIQCEQIEQRASEQTLAGSRTLAQDL